jgi:SAM-dependent methyltransferase
MPETMSQSGFDELAASYDRLVDWPKRLAREAPFFRELFEMHGVRRVLDAGCGTGHHATMFHSWGLEVVGMDVSPAMLEQCARLHGRDERLHWVQGSFAAPPSPSKQFDAVVCIGNSLALVDDLEGVRTAVRAMVNSVRPGGIGIIQLLNSGSIHEGPTLWQKVCRFERGGLPVVLLKGVHRSNGRGYVDIVELTLHPRQVDWRTHAASFLCITGPELTSIIREQGGQVKGVFGSYERQEFIAGQSTDLIVVFGVHREVSMGCFRP